MLLSLYRGLTTLAGPAVRLYLRHRERRGKEEVARRGERLGRATVPRPHGRLVWLHGASVGEANSALILIDRLLQADPALTVLMTTGTVTSARLMAGRLPPRAMHQYVPVDLPGAVRGFLDHWHPDAVVWMESELWPNLLSEVGRRRIPAALVNGRMSARSFAGWQRVPVLAARLLAVFDLVLAQSDDDGRRFAALGAPKVDCVGNLKLSALPQPADPAAGEQLAAAIAGRPVWLLASSHPGEEAMALRAHALIKAARPDVLTVILPRHAHRGAEVAGLAAAAGLRAGRRSCGALPQAGDDVYIADTMGEVGVFYRLIPVVCMGGSFVPHGGQNPVEPALLGACVLYGPHMFNFAGITAQLEAAGGALPVAEETALAAAVARLLADNSARAGLMAGAAAVARENHRIVDAVVAALYPVLSAGGISAAIGSDN